MNTQHSHTVLSLLFCDHYLDNDRTVTLVFSEVADIGVLNPEEPSLTPVRAKVSTGPEIVDVAVGMVAIKHDRIINDASAVNHGGEDAALVELKAGGAHGRPDGTLADLCQQVLISAIEGLKTLQLAKETGDLLGGADTPLVKVGRLLLVIHAVHHGAVGAVGPATVAAAAASNGAVDDLLGGEILVALLGDSAGHLSGRSSSESPAGAAGLGVARGADLDVVQPVEAGPEGGRIISELSLGNLGLGVSLDKGSTGRDLEARDLLAELSGGKVGELCHTESVGLLVLVGLGQLVDVVLESLEACSKSRRGIGALELGNKLLEHRRVLSRLEEVSNNALAGVGVGLGGSHKEHRHDEHTGHQTHALHTAS